MKLRVGLLGAGALGLACGVLGVAWWLRPPQPNLNPDYFNHLYPGMTRDAVHAMFAAPPGDYTPPGQKPPGAIESDPEKPFHTAEEWRDDVAVVRVYFDADGRVVDWRGMFSNRRPESVWQRLRRVLGL
jgi:hypothetical protein